MTRVTHITQTMTNTHITASQTHTQQDSSTKQTRSRTNGTKGTGAERQHTERAAGAGAARQQGQTRSVRGGMWTLCGGYCIGCLLLGNGEGPSCSVGMPTVHQQFMLHLQPHCMSTHPPASLHKSHRTPSPPPPTHTHTPQRTYQSHTCGRKCDVEY
jgi:hypothetical protein